MSCNAWLLAQSRLIVLPAALSFFAQSAHGQADVMLKPIGGGGGGQFDARCPQGQLLNGLDLLTGDDVDAIKPICVTATGPADAGPAVPGGIWFGGNGGPKPVRIICPKWTPIATGIFVRAQGVATVVVNGLSLQCGIAAKTQPEDAWTPRFEEADKNYDYIHPGRAFLGLGIFNPRADHVPEVQAKQSCPAGLVAVGITGRSGVWLDAVGLVCNEPTLVPQSGPTKAIGRVKVSDAAVPQRPICELSREARLRNSPAAPGLDERCRAGLAAIGEAIAQGDPVVAEARAEETDAMFRRGFDIASGIFGNPAQGAQGNTAMGPNSQGIRNSLSVAGQRGFDASVKLHLNRNQRR